MAKQVECPECGATVELDDDVISGEIVECPDCAVELEVTSVDPLEVELAPEEDEDWGE
ncbi:MAG: lysine biosynthesis protein LysW [Anaerolineae bacterium]|nr:lysine biosynthesis protein LysW [Anaerolineae bacterium]